MSQQTEFKDDQHQQVDIRPKVLAQPQQQQTSTTTELDAALLVFARTGISQRRPRTNTGNVEVSKQGSTIVVRDTSSLSNVMEICSVESILGMGVVNETDRCVGIIDVPGITRYLLQHCLKDCCDNTTLNTTLTADCCTKIQQCMNTTTVMDVVNWLDQRHNCPLLPANQRSAAAAATTTTTTTTTATSAAPTTALPRHVNPFCSSMVIPEGHSLLFAMELLCHSGVKRVVTVDNDQRCTGFYSTSMAISDIRQQAHLLRPFTQRTVQSCLDLCRQANQRCVDNETGDDMVCTTPPVLSLPITATAFEAFKLMIDNNISGLALLDGNNKLTGTISIRDIRGLGKTFEHLDRLTLSLKDFKSLTLKEYPQIAPTTHWASDSKVPMGSRFVELERGTMRDIILATQDANIQRIMIMNNDGELAGIITLQDVIRCFLDSLGCMDQ